MGLKDMLKHIRDDPHYAWEKPVFSAVRNFYVRPGSRTYERTYKSGILRRALLPRKVLRELKVPDISSGLSMLLNTALKGLRVQEGELDFFRAGCMDYYLRHENETEVKETLRRMGSEYCENLSHITPDDFNEAYEVLMIFYDLMLGARWEDITPPAPGFAHYSYPREEYPFEEGSPSEIVMWSFGQGAASVLHSGREKQREMRALVDHGDERVIVISKERHGFTPEELELTF